VTIKIGSGVIPQKLEMTLYGLSDNSEQTIIISPTDAFGERDSKKIQNINMDSFPNKEMIEIGNVIEIDIRESDGNEVSTFAMIKNINKNDVQLDLNHPLAGIEIKFKVKIIEVYE
jgi:FKBP-type peptidyl-prolyl cis-trans isomerase 2